MSEQGEPNALSGADRVAALLLAMGPPLARRLLPHFDPTELKQISQAATGLGAVPASDIEPVIEEFATQFSAGLNLLGSSRAVEEMLTGVMEPDEIERLMNEPIITREPTVWERLANMTDGVLAKYLMQEHPQTIAFVLNNIEAATASSTLRAFAPEQRDELMRRMLCARKPADAVRQAVVDMLNADLLGGGSHVVETSRHEHLAQIMNGMEREEIETVLDNLESVRPKAAKALKSMLFTFQDMADLGERARAAVLERVPTERLVVALRGTDQAFRDTVLAGLSARERRIAENELENGDGATKRDVRQARRAIAAIALDLANEGEIVLDASKEQEQVV